MNNQISKQYILSRIKKAGALRLESKISLPDMLNPVYKEIQPSALDCFKNELETVSGYCTVCKSEDDLAEKLKQWMSAQNISTLFCKDTTISSFLKSRHIDYTLDKDKFISMQAGITGCEFLVARTGSVVISSAGESGRQMNIFPPTHVVIAKKEQLVDYPADALEALQKKYGEVLPSMISFVSGPSRTADIEKTLVLGAHGPKMLHVFIY